jgi:hypothetical protein
MYAYQWSIAFLSAWRTFGGSKKFIAHYSRGFARGAKYSPPLKLNMDGVVVPASLVWYHISKAWTLCCWRGILCNTRITQQLHPHVYKNVQSFEFVVRLFMQKWTNVSSNNSLQFRSKFYISMTTFESVSACAWWDNWHHDISPPLLLLHHHHHHHTHRHRQCGSWDTRPRENDPLVLATLRWPSFCGHHSCMAGVDSRVDTRSSPLCYSHHGSDWRGWIYLRKMVGTWFGQASTEVIFGG